MRTDRTTLAVLAVIALATPLVPLGSPLGAAASVAAPEVACTSTSVGVLDLDDDGREDRVVPMPRARGGRGVVVVEQSRAGTVTLDLAALGGGPARPGDRLGQTIRGWAWGCGKLLITAPGAREGRGSAFFVMGSAQGVLEGRETVRVEPALQRGDRFGASIGQPWGEYVDGRIQLMIAVGAPGTDVGRVRDAGAVHLLRAPLDDDEVPLSAELTDRWTLRTEGTPGRPRQGDRFGSVMTGRATVGVPGKDLGRRRDAGVVMVTHDRDDGLRAPWRGEVTMLRQGRGGIRGTAESGDRFGAALWQWYGAGGVVALAIGSPGEDVRGVRDAGTVHANTWVGGKNVWRKFRQGGRAGGTPEHGDRFGSSVAILVGEDGPDRVIAGSPGEDVRGVRDAGAVNVVNSRSRSGKHITLGRRAARGDRLGAAIVMRMASDDDYEWSSAWAGVPGRDLGGRRDTGALLNLADRRLTGIAAYGGAPSAGDRLGAVGWDLYRFG